MRFARGIAGMCALALGACADAPSSPAASAAPRPIIGTHWIGVVGKDADPHTLPRLEFVSEGRLTGYTGCNLFSGAWKMQDAEVRVGGLAMTKRMCLGEAGEIEKRFLAALGPGAHGRREGDRLVFTGPKGERFEFEPAAAT